jgi:hypothetical protein
LEAFVLSDPLAAGLASDFVEGSVGAAVWLEQATEMPRRIATTERLLIGELLVRSGWNAPAMKASMPVRPTAARVKI